MFERSPSSQPSELHPEMVDSDDTVPDGESVIYSMDDSEDPEELKEYIKYPLKKYVAASWLPSYKFGPRAAPDWNWPVYSELHTAPGVRTLRVMMRIPREKINYSTEIWHHEMVAMDLSIDPERSSGFLYLPSVEVMDYDEEDITFLEQDVNYVTDLTKLLKKCMLSTISQLIQYVHQFGPPELFPKMQFKEAYHFRAAGGARWDILEVPGDDEDTSSMIMIVVPPWQFDLNEFREFTREGVQAKGSLELSPAVTPHHACTILWALLWDLCTMRKSQYFVVTTYEHWAFGNFSKDRRVATVTEPIEALVASVTSIPSPIPVPNIVQMLMFWMGSSTNIGVYRDEWVLPTDDIVDKLPAQLI